MFERIIEKFFPELCLTFAQESAVLSIKDENAIEMEPENLDDSNKTGNGVTGLNFNKS